MSNSINLPNDGKNQSAVPLQTQGTSSVGQMIWGSIAGTGALITHMIISGLVCALGFGFFHVIVYPPSKDHPAQQHSQWLFPRNNQSLDGSSTGTTALLYLPPPQEQASRIAIAAPATSYASFMQGVYLGLAFGAAIGAFLSLRVKGTFPLGSLLAGIIMVSLSLYIFHISLTMTSTLVAYLASIVVSCLISMYAYGAEKPDHFYEAIGTTLMLMILGALAGGFVYGVYHALSTSSGTFSALFLAAVPLGAVGGAMLGAAGSVNANSELNAQARLAAGALVGAALVAGLFFFTGFHSFEPSTTFTAFPVAMLVGSLAGASYVKAQA